MEASKLQEFLQEALREERYKKEDKPSPRKDAGPSSRLFKLLYGINKHGVVVRGWLLDAFALLNCQEKMSVVHVSTPSPLSTLNGGSVAQGCRLMINHVA